MYIFNGCPEGGVAHTCPSGKYTGRSVDSGSQRAIVEIEVLDSSVEDTEYGCLLIILGSGKFKVADGVVVAVEVNCLVKGIIVDLFISGLGLHV